MKTDRVIERLEHLRSIETAMLKNNELPYATEGYVRETIEALRMAIEIIREVKDVHRDNGQEE